VTPTIETTRLKLLPVRPEDATEMVGVLADPSLYRFIGGAPHPLPELEALYRRWVRGAPRSGETWHNWVIRRGEGGEAIGHLQATVLSDDRSADIAWMVGTAWQRHGYATEAARALVGWLEANGIETITAHVHPDNVASSRVAERAGLAVTDEIEDGEVLWRRAASAY
jgi:RimJ/RimL family protein N-acetyltransferase